jgi:hypothetical protein
MNTNQEHRFKNRVGRDLILMYGPAVRSQEAFGDEEVGSMREADVRGILIRCCGARMARSYICWFEDIDAGDAESVGGKNASLGEMVRNLGKNGLRGRSRLGDPTRNAKSRVPRRILRKPFAKLTGICRSAWEWTRGGTVRPHDARAHEDKRRRLPLLEKELAECGLRRI